MYEVVATTPQYGDEVIEQDIVTKAEAAYLRDEYRLAYQGTGIAVRLRMQRKRKTKAKG